MNLIFPLTPHHHHLAHPGTQYLQSTCRLVWSSSPWLLLCFPTLPMGVDYIGIYQARVGMFSCLACRAKPHRVRKVIVNNSHVPLHITLVYYLLTCLLSANEKEPVLICIYSYFWQGMSTQTLAPIQ